MRNWTIPGHWGPEPAAPVEPQELIAPAELPLSPMRRQPLRKSGGFVQMENIFAELDEEIGANRR